MTAHSDTRRSAAPANDIDSVEHRLRTLAASIPESGADLTSARARFTARYCRALRARAGRSRPEIAESLLDKIARAAATLAAESSQTTEILDTKETLPAPPHHRLQDLQQLLGPQTDPEEVSRQGIAATLGFAAGRGPDGGRGDLQAARQLRALQGRYRLDQVLAAAATQRPETPGPLNPQSLIVRALTEMHDISPAYLSRFISYSRQLLWLGKATEKKKNK